VTQPGNKEDRHPAPRRLESLDAFRGMVIVLMFLVNVAGHDPAFPGWFRHRGWNGGGMGNGLADFVFPWFLFIVGVAIPFSMASGRGRGVPAWRRMLKALRRGVTIYLLGTLLWCATIAYDRPITLDVFLHWDILPLIGFGYVLGVVLHHTPVWGRIAFVAAVLAGKWAILRVVAHPELGEVVWTQTESTQHWVRAELGWLGTALTQGLPAASLVVLGDLTGEVLGRDRGCPKRRAAWLGVAGLALAGLGYAWHLLGLPFSKDFFTSSYVLVTAGTGVAVLAAMLFLVDVARVTRLTPLRVYGLNAITVYVLAELLWKTVWMRWQVATPGGGSSLAITAAKAWLAVPLGEMLAAWARVGLYIVLYWLVAAWMHRRGLYLKV
jgi:predicted acyltransferase